LDVEAVINQLLDQNKELRLQLAMLTAQKKQQDDIERQMNESQRGITPEVLDSLSPAAREALMNMEIK
jgi:hypothetical protein